MAIDFCISVEDKPGEFSRIAEALGQEGINIEGFSGVRTEGRGIIRLLTDDPERTRGVLDSSGITYETCEVVLTHLMHVPGQFAKFSKALSDAGINTTGLYTGMNNWQVVASDDPEKVRKIAASFGAFEG